MSATIAPLNDSVVLLALFLVFHIFSWIGCAVMLLVTVFASTIRRHVTWSNLCFGWIIACFSFSFLFITGQLNKRNPSFTICILQAASIYAAPMLTAGVMLAFALYLYTSITRTPGPGRSLVLDSMLLILPYIAPATMYFGVIAFGITTPDKVKVAESMMYCGVGHPLPGKISAVFVAVLMVPTFVLEAFALHRLYRTDTYSPDGLSSVIRLGVFTLFSIFGISISLTYLSDRDYGRLPNVLMALQPLSFVLIFGSQMALMFWRKRQSPESDWHEL